MVEVEATEIIVRFTNCLSTMSHSRAGWDFYAMPQEQRAREDREEKAALVLARAIWWDNPGLRDQLREAFTAANPLATMTEIEHGG